MNDIIKETASIWNERLTYLMKKEGYTQETFYKSFKKKYGKCTQTNVSRWCRVGNIISDKNSGKKKIGFPSYENMIKIADFFGVSLGYLIGETDFETFEMERACKILCINEATGNAIRGIATGKSIGCFEKYLSDKYEATLGCLVTTESFPTFIKKLRELSENIYRQKHPVNYQALAIKKINPDIIELAYQCLDYTCGYDEAYGEIDEFQDNDVIPTSELLDAIRILNDAIDKDYSQPQKLEFNVKLSKYELLEVYFEMIEEVVDSEHLGNMTVPLINEIQPDKNAE